MEIDEARSAGAFDVQAVGYEIEIGLKNFVLGMQKFQPEGSQDLRCFAGDRAGVDVVLDAGKLHRDRGTADLSVLLDIRMPYSAKERSRTHTRMEPEPLVLVQKGSLDQNRRDGFQRQPQPVLLVPRESQANELPASVVDRLGETDVGFKGRGKEAEKNENDYERDCYAGKTFQQCFL